MRVLETQREIIINDIRYALKQEELRRDKRNEEKISKDECVRKAREKSRNNVMCYNCGLKGHTSSECRNKQKCFNCQGFNHIAANCNEPKKGSLQGRGFKRISRDRGKRRGYGNNEVTLKTSDEAVLSVRDTMHANIIQSDKKRKQDNA